MITVVKRSNKLHFKSIEEMKKYFYENGNKFFDTNSQALENESNNSELSEQAPRNDRGCNRSYPPDETQRISK